MHRQVRGVILLLAAAALWSRPGAAQAPSAAPLQAGDRISLKIWLDTTFADTVRIDHRGAATLPRIGPVDLSGVPADQVADSVRRVYATLTRTPAVEVTPLRRVTVGGEVSEPGVYFLETSATVREAITAAKGITDIGATGAVMLMRGNSNIAVRNWEQRAGADVVLQSGDVVWVRRESWFKRNAFSLVSGVSVLVSLVLSLR